MLRMRFVAIATAATLQALLFWHCAPSAEKATVNKAALGEKYNGRWLVTFNPADRERVGWIQLEGVGTPDAKGLIVGVPGGGMYPLTSVSVADDGSLRLEYSGSWGSNIPEIAAKEREERMAARAKLKEGEKLPKQPPITSVYTATLEGDQLVGKQEWPSEPTRFQVVTFTAKRPEIHEHDDGTWVAGEVVQLVPDKPASNGNFTVELRTRNWVGR